MICSFFLFALPPVSEVRLVNDFSLKKKKKKSIKINKTRGGEAPAAA